MDDERVQAALLRLGIKPSKEKGQNFLIDASALEAIVAFGRPGRGGALVEIGPGLGALTAELAPVGKLTLIELEPLFCRELERRFPEAEVIEADVRAVDFGEIGRDLVVFGNLPYSHSTDILFHLFDQAEFVQRAVLLLQREFVERLQADPGGRTYGVLSIMCQLRADIFGGPVISGSSFHPSAKVNSQAVELVFLKQPRFPIADPIRLRSVVSAAFFRRRKKILNSMKASGAYPLELLRASLTRAAVDPERRAETLSPEEFVRLADCLSSVIEERPELSEFS